MNLDMLNTVLLVVVLVLVVMCCVRQNENYENNAPLLTGYVGPNSPNVGSVTVKAENGNTMFSNADTGGTTSVGNFNPNSMVQLTNSGDMLNSGGMASMDSIN
mgnify:CR=1 FL=1